MNKAILFGTLVSLGSLTVLISGQPKWWSEYSLVNASPREDQVVATIGQAKHAVQKAYHYLEEALSSIGGAGPEVTHIFNQFCSTAPSATSNDLRALTLGQLKYLGKPFYDRINHPSVAFDTSDMNAASADIYPWTKGQSDDADLALATIGQLKFVFSFDLEAWTPPVRESRLNVFPESLSVALRWGETETSALTLMNTGSSNINYSIRIEGAEIPGRRAYEQENSFYDGTAYQLNDISTSGTEMGHISNVEDGYEQVALPETSDFAFPFYGETYSEVFVGTNGILSFAASDGIYTSTPFFMPYPSDFNFYVAPYWADLNPARSPEAKIYFKEESNPQRLIIQYNKIPHANINDKGEFTFQVVLHADGQIFFYYDEIILDLERGIAGIEDELGQDGVLVSYLGWWGLPIQSGLAVRVFESPKFVSVDQMSGVVAAGEKLDLNVSYDLSAVNDPGVYDAMLKITHDGSNASPIDVPITMEYVNNPPEVQLLAPFDGVSIETGGSLFVSAIASDSDSGVDYVEFFEGGVLFDEVRRTNSFGEYRVSWRAPDSPGQYELTARAVDEYGLTATTTPIAVNVIEDFDSDGMEDNWEVDNFGNKDQSGFGDFDGDGMPNVFEYAHGTNPTTSEKITYSDTQDFESNYYIVDASLEAESEYKKKTLRAAIDAAGSYAVIEVFPGNYVGELVEVRKALYIFGTAGARHTVFDYSTTDFVEVLPLGIFAECVISGLTFKGSDIEIGGTLSLISAPFSNNGVQFTGCRFIENSCKRVTSVFYVGATDLTLISCTVANNSSNSATAIYSRASSSYPNEIKIINSIIWNDEDGYDIDADYYTVITCENSIIRSANQEILGTVPLTDDPEFAFDYSLSATSPARNAGLSRLYADPDCDGEAHVDGLVDIGADEFVDTNSDGLPDWLDSFYGASLTPGGDYDADYMGNLDEYLARTDLSLKDTDSDGNSDPQEIYIFSTDPRDADSYINLSTLSPYLNTSDPDADGLSGTWEIVYGYNPFVDEGESSQDPDGDGLSNQFEFLVRTNPNRYNVFFGRDNDGDGIPDLWEFNNGLDLDDHGDAELDTDGDLLTSYQEYIAGTNPQVADQNENSLLDGDGADDVDADGIPNGWEKSNGLDFLDSSDALIDSDSDGLSNYWEYVLGYSWNNPDSLGDGTLDGGRDDDSDLMPNFWEVLYGLNPSSEPSLTDWDLDPDEDGLINYWEYLMGTDPHNSDTDDDGTSDGLEDSDGDRISDSWELQYLLNPLDEGDGNVDGDMDGLSNRYEFLLGTDPTSVDSNLDGNEDGALDFDGDGMTNAWEIGHGLNPLNAADADINPDADRLTNVQEFTVDTDPGVWDTDGDGVADGDVDTDGDLMGDAWEINYGLNPNLPDDALQDPDSDGVINRSEYVNNTDPWDQDGGVVNLIIYSPLE